MLHTTSEVTSLASTQFCQGKTMRWGVAWTFVPGIDLRSVQSVKAKKSKEKPFIWSISRKEKKERNAGRTYGLLLAPWLRDLEVETEVGLSSQHLCTVKLTARKNTWVKQRRKRREEARTEKMEEDLDPESANPEIWQAPTISKSKHVVSGNASQGFQIRRPLRGS